MIIIKTIKNARVQYDQHESFKGFNLYVKEKSYDGKEVYCAWGILAEDETRHENGIKYIPLNELINMKSHTSEFDVIKLTKGTLYADHNGIPAYYGNVVLYKK